MNPKTIVAFTICFFAMAQFLQAGTIAENCKRFGNIVIASVNFQKASPEEATDFVNLIWRSTDPHVKDLDLKLARGAFKGRTVTLRASGIKLADLVGHIAEQLKAEVVIRNDSILFAPGNGEAGTGQPATSPESKPEGSHKPQPEAEGRSH
jgi:hypothetical protein